MAQVTNQVRCYCAIAATALTLTALITACSNSSGTLGGTGLADTKGPTGTGPTGLVVDAGPPSSDAGDAADAPSGPEALFDALEASLMASCGSCHGDPTRPAQYPKWLVGPDRYTTIKAYPGIVVPNVQASKLITIGVTVQHAGGPGLEGQLLTDVTAWLTAEANALAATPLATTAPFAPTTGANTVDLSSIVPGASLSFSAAPSPDGTLLTFTNLTINAPQTSGLHVAHPIFAIVSGGQAFEDVADSFSNTDETVPQGESEPLGDGVFVLDVEATINGPWQMGDELEVAFATLATADVPPPDGGLDDGGDGGEGGTVAPGGCQSVATFVSDAVPAIMANSCLTCHQGQNAGATAQMDLSMLGTNNTVACAQALTKVDLTNKPQSEIILAPTGGIAGHPFQSASANYKTMMLAWINNE